MQVCLHSKTANLDLERRKGTGARWTAFLALVLLAGAIGAMLLRPMRVEAVTREILELQRDVDQLIQSQKGIQTMLTQKAAVDKTLKEQSVDTVNRMANPIIVLQERVRNMYTASFLFLDATSTQIGESSVNLRGALARTDKLKEQLTEMQNAVRRIDAKLSERAPASVPVQGTVSPRIRPRPNR